MEQLNDIVVAINAEMKVRVPFGGVAWRPRVESVQPDCALWASALLTPRRVRAQKVEKHAETIDFVHGVWAGYNSKLGICFENILPKKSASSS